MLVEHLSTVLTSLQPWTNYSIMVAAFTVAGEGVKSLPVMCVTLEDGKEVFIIKIILSTMEIII